MKKILALLVVIAVAVTSCSKDSGNGGPAFKPAITKLNLASKVPSNLQTTSPDTWTQISQMEAYMNLGAAYMTKPSGKTTTMSDSSWTWTYGNYTVTYTYSLVGTQYQFTYTMTEGSTTYYTITGWENTDGSAGHWAYTLNTAVVGDPTGSDFNITFDWTKNAADDYHFVMNFDMGAGSNLHYVANINHDHSGDFLYTSNGTNYYGGNWNAAGHGQYTDYLTDPITVTTF